MAPQRVVHSLEVATTRPLCGREVGEHWSWSTMPSTVSCPYCRRRLDGAEVDGSPLDAARAQRDGT